ncbi:MAG: lipopeptide [Gammaproteobacteria bacterium]|nr:MAG: lipopeptide [Gammaproteobacteria bacterium]
MPINYYQSIFYLSMLFFLTGCGQMGPLYLPDQKPSVYIPHHFAKPSS